MNATLKYKAPAVKYRTKNNVSLATIANRHNHEFEFEPFTITIAGDKYSTDVLKKTKPIEIEEVNGLAYPDDKFIYTDEKNNKHFDVKRYSDYITKQHPAFSFGEVVALYRDNMWHVEKETIGKKDLTAIIANDLEAHQVGNYSTDSKTIGKIVFDPDYSCTKFLITAKSVKYDKSP